MTGHEGPVTWVDYSHDGRLLVSAGDDATARVWDTETGELVSLLSGAAYWIHRARFSPDGARIATASNGGSADMWNTLDGRHLAALTENTGTPNKVQSVAFSKDGRRLLTANSDGSVREWDVSRLTQSWETLSADACANLLIPATQAFSETEVLADPLLATQWRQSDRNVCAAQNE
jgi:WD40 repeat protein